MAELCRAIHMTPGHAAATSDTGSSDPRTLPGAVSRRNGGSGSLNYVIALLRQPLS